ncbi:hypothetical protein B0H14DRAFT_214204 [Mycena olivaceomarginata]|nr:hypothetical protein B0H14DRAFT_214204 [Mycena olivaceomarginata]
MMTLARIFSSPFHGLLPAVSAGTSRNESAHAFHRPGRAASNEFVRDVRFSTPILRPFHSGCKNYPTRCATVIRGLQNPSKSRHLFTMQIWFAGAPNSITTRPSITFDDISVDSDNSAYASKQLDFYKKHFHPIHENLRDTMYFV